MMKAPIIVPEMPPTPPMREAPPITAAAMASSSYITPSLGWAVTRRDISTLPAVEGVALGRPTYVNGAAGNYRLALNSLGVDFAPPIVGDDRDLDNNPHDQDLPEVGNLYGVRDLGAYERQRSCGAGDTIFCDGLGDP